MMEWKTAAAITLAVVLVLVALQKAWAAIRWKIALRAAYQARPLFSAHERTAYYKLKRMTERLGLTLFTKVRLLDLAEPREGIWHYKTFLYKVQSKHVDFVVCDAKLSARLVIELDDSTHDRADRRRRDRFVDEVLKTCGYQVVHTRDIDERELWPVLAHLGRR